MSAIPICHRSETCWHCTESAGSGFRSTRSVRPWKGRFEHGHFRDKFHYRKFICQGCITHAAAVLAGRPDTEITQAVRRARRSAVP